MELKPVKEYKKPKYPDKQMAVDNHRLLRSLPDRWKDNACVCVALSTLFMFTLSGCRQVDAPKPVEVKASVAPVFEHGKGRGSFGCMSVSPPAFLSEEEAFQVIQEETGKYGISFERNKIQIEGAGIPETKYFLKSENKPQGLREKGGEINTAKPGTLQLDGYDASRKIGFEFISQEDYKTWSVQQEIRSSVDDFDFLSTAKVLQEGLKGRNGDASIGVFYNPMEQLPRKELNVIMAQENWDAMESRVKQMAEAELREQVRDFLGWLKAQGIV